MSIIDLAIKGADMLTGGVAGSIIQSGQDARQREQQAHFTREQVQANKELAHFNRQQQKQLWLDTGIAAQMQEAIKSGINPNSLFAKGGATGQTGSGGGGGVQGGIAGDPNAGARNTIDLMMQRAQVANLEASTKKLEAEANKTAGVDTEAAKLDIDFNKLRNQIQGETLYNQIDMILDASRKLRSEALVGENTAPQQIEKATLELTNLAINAIAADKGVKLTEAKINEISESIAQKWQELNIKETSNRWEHNDRLKAIEEYTSAMLWGAGINATGQVIGDAAKIITAPKQAIGKTVETIGRDGGRHFERTFNHYK